MSASKDMELVEFGRVTTASKEKGDPLETPDVPYIGLEHIEKETGVHNGQGIASDVRSTKSVFRTGDLLYGKLRPYLNKVWIAQFDGLCSTDILVFPKHDSVDNKFLKYRFMAADFVRYATENSSGVNLPRVNAKVLAKFPLWIPSPEEQQRIVVKIEKQFTRLEAGVDGLKRVQTNLKRYRASVLKAACEGWPSVALSDVCKVVSGYAFKSSCFCDKGIPITKIANVSYGEYLDKAPSFLPHTYLKEYRRFKICAGNILLALTRPITNNQIKTCLYPVDLPDALLNQRVAKLEPTERILRGYLLAYLRTDHFKSVITAVMPQTLQPNLSPRDLAALPIPLPPLAEQKRIVEDVERRLSVIEEMEVAVTANLKRAARLRQSILKKAFEGKLV